MVSSELFSLCFGHAPPCRYIKFYHIGKKLKPAVDAALDGAKMMGGPTMMGQKVAYMKGKNESGEPAMYGQPIMKGTFMSKCDKSKM